MINWKPCFLASSMLLTALAAPIRTGAQEMETAQVSYGAQAVSTPALPADAAAVPDAVPGFYFSQGSWAPHPLPTASTDTVFGDANYIDPAFLTRKVTISCQGMTWVTGMDAFAAIPVRLTNVGGRIGCEFLNLSTFDAFFAAVSAQLGQATRQSVPKKALYDNGAGSYIYLDDCSWLEASASMGQWLADTLENMVLNGICTDISLELSGDFLTPVTESVLRFSPDYVLAGTSSSSFADSDANRCTNVEVAASRIHNRILMPGESLSASSAFLPRTKANGYKMAGVYLNGVHTLGMGGGVCQVSSDLYHAAMNAGLTVTERWPHSMPVPYAQLGLDAAIAQGYKDLKIRNDYDCPIAICAETDNKQLTVSIYVPGQSMGGKTYRLWAEQTGELSAKTWLTTYQNGAAVKTAYIGRSRYNPLREAADAP